MYIPDQGDIIWLDFDPSRGKEFMKYRPAFVISKKAFSKYTKMTVVAPITSTIRYNNQLEVILPNNIKTEGSILIYQLASIDFIDRKAKFIEKAPISVIDKVLLIAGAIIS